MYKLIFKLAFNNAFLRLSRTVLVVVMIAVSMSMMLSIQGLYDGMTHTMVEKTKRSDTGEISLFHPQYRLNKELQYSIKKSDSIVKKLETNPHIKAIVLRLKAQGLSATARKSAFSTMIGIDLDAEEKFGNLGAFLKEGKLTLEGRNILIGSELAKTLKIKIGSKIIFSTQDNHGEINAMALKVGGILQTSNISLDASALYISRSKLASFLGVDAQTVSQIALRTAQNTPEESLLTLLQKTYPTLEIENFLTLYPMIKQMQDMTVIFNSITFFIVMLVVFIGIMGVMYVSILDRIREFGMMQSIGLSYSLIRLQILLEALFVGLLGYLLGAILGFGILSYLYHIGLDLSAYADGMERFGMGTVIHADMKLGYFTTTFMAIVSASLLSVILPLRKIKTMNTIEVTKVEI